MSLLDLNWSIADWTLILITIVTLLYFLGTMNFSRFTKYNIPHMKPLPFLGNMGQTIIKGQAFPDQILQFYNNLKQHPYAGFFMFNHPVILINDPELIKDITVKDFDHFTDHRGVFSEETEPLWSKGLVNLKGQQWKDVRSKLSPAFTSSKMKTMFVLISECCQQFVNFLRECKKQEEPTCNITKDGDTLVLELKEFFTRYTNDVIATTAFGIGVDSLKQPKNEFFIKGQEATRLGIWRFFGHMAFPKLMNLLKIKIIPGHVTNFLKSLILEAMKTREEKGIVRPDMLQLLIEAKKNAAGQENEKINGHKIEVDDDIIIAQALLFFLAGFDTASTLLCFVCYQLADFPDIQEKLQKEVDQTLEENRGKFTYEAVNSMKYLDMVVSETLRIYPPGAAIERICNKQYTLKANPPTEIFPGDHLFIPIYGLHRDPKYYTDPDKFDPERFNDENKHTINPTTYIPFGIGPRICIGNRFALMETKLALVHMLSKFNIVRVKKTPKSIKIIQKGLNISIAGGFWMGLEERQ